ncbi:hypothetical protein FRC12_000677 [Ceratobasidium sp. 428]|nr:hypothetical protein FRC12_000677 [Ceratobasidium sp. 428]
MSIRTLTVLSPTPTLMHVISVHGLTYGVPPTTPPLSTFEHRVPLCAPAGPRALRLSSLPALVRAIGSYARRQQRPDRPPTITHIPAPVYTAHARQH